MGRGASVKGYLQNLSTKQLMKFIYNPEEVDYGWSTEYAVIKAPGSPHPLYQFVGGDEQSPTTTILIDGREHGGYSATRSQMNFIDAFHPASHGYNSFNPSPMALFAVGSFVKKVLITDVQYRIILFDKSLNPLRVECDLTMKTVM